MRPATTDAKPIRAVVADWIDLRPIAWLPLRASLALNSSEQSMLWNAIATQLHTKLHRAVHTQRDAVSSRAVTRCAGRLREPAAGAERDAVHAAVQRRRRGERAIRAACKERHSAGVDMAARQGLPLRVPDAAEHLGRRRLLARPAMQLLAYAVQHSPVPTVPCRCTLLWLASLYALWND